MRFMIGLSFVVHAIILAMVYILRYVEGVDTSLFFGLSVAVLMVYIGFLLTYYDKKGRQ